MTVSVKSFPDNWRLALPAGLILIGLLLFVLYLPGLSGPYTLDDNSNLLANKYLQITQLDLASLKNAAFSMSSGPTGRPVSMLSFALNYYEAGSFDSSTPYKVTNLFIHIVNSFLVFWFLYLIVFPVQDRTTPLSPVPGSYRATTIFCVVVTLLWAIHPIQLTSVLYVVQRMAALAGTFTLLALISYLVGRRLWLTRKKTGMALVLLVTPLSTLVGILAKENAALVPIYIVSIEATIFRLLFPWSSWKLLPGHTRQIVVISGIVLLALLALWFVNYSMPGYSTRPFSMFERVLTEGRVLVFYISLILVPRINAFGLHHDDIQISHGFFTPWTTTPSLILLAVLLVTAFYFRKSRPLFSLGIFLFFSAHLLESTVYPLDIAYEHRNYFASLGILLSASDFVRAGGRRINRNITAIFIIAFVVLTASTTYLRSTQWRSDASLYSFEAFHHPESAILNFELAGLLDGYGKRREAVSAARKSVSLDPGRISFRLQLALLMAKYNLPVDRDNSDSITKLMRTGNVQPTGRLLLNKMMQCINSECASLLPEAEKWLTALVNQKTVNYRPYTYHHMLGAVKFAMGKYSQAEDQLLESIRLKPKYIVAYTDLAVVYSVTKQPGKAIPIYKKLLVIDPANSEEYKNRISGLLGNN